MVVLATRAILNRPTAKLYVYWCGTEGYIAVICYKGVPPPELLGRVELPPHDYTVAYRADREGVVVSEILYHSAQFLTPDEVLEVLGEGEV